MKNILTLIAVAVVLNGCASTPEYVKNLKPEDLLFAAQEDVDLKHDLEATAANLGHNKSGFIAPDRSKERIDFENQYPIKPHGLKNLESIDSGFYSHRVGQVLRLSADLDKRTSGFIKNENGFPLSVSGMIQITADPAISSALTTGASQAIASTTSSASSINPSQSAGQNIGAGLGVGLIAGGFHAVLASSSKDGIIKKEDFGGLMEETTFSYVMPSASSLPSDGRWEFRNTKSTINVAPGVIRRIYVVQGEKTLDYKNRLFFLSTVATYRGDSYREKYPNTEGWEFRITNINTATIPDTGSLEQRFIELKKALTRQNIKF